MALKITLKPHERLIIGGAVVTNGSTKCELMFENKVPILREKDILTEDKADTPCRRVYFVVQLMYVDEANLVNYHNGYWQLVQDIIKAAPSTIPIIDRISENILQGKYYQALKTARKLVDYEQEVLSHAQNSRGSLQEDPDANDVGS